MKKTVTVLATAAAIAVSAVALPEQAEARWGRGWHGGGWHGGWGRGWGGPFVGGLAAGALLGSAFAPRYYGYYGPGPYYGAYGGCYSRRVWTPYGWRWRRVCY